MPPKNRRPTRPFDLVIFDCDGVLVDSEPLSIAGLVEVLGEDGYALDEAAAYRRFLGRSSGSIFEEIARDRGVVSAPALAERFQERVMAAFRASLAPISGIVELLAELDLPACVASSSSSERVRLALEVCGLSRFFGERVFTAQMVANAKPAPDLFLLAARRCAARPERCLVIEDSANGIEAARAAGMAVWHFHGGSHFGPGRASHALGHGADAAFAEMAALKRALVARAAATA